MSYKSTNYLKASLAMFIIICAFLLQGCMINKGPLCGQGMAGEGHAVKAVKGAPRHSF